MYEKLTFLITPLRKHSFNTFCPVYKNPIVCVGKTGFVLNDFKMLARFSKCDFWIPGQILDVNIFFPKMK